jgi:dCMP deaminase
MAKINFMTIAEEVSKASSCKRNKVGAVIVKDDRIISIGYNGTPTGAISNCCEDGDKTKDDVIHAEMNAILFAVKNGISTKDCTLYVTLSPCKECAKNIIQSGIKKVIYKDLYRDATGIKMLNQYIEVGKTNE